MLLSRFSLFMILVSAAFKVRPCRVFSPNIGIFFAWFPPLSQAAGPLVTPLRPARRGGSEAGLPPVSHHLGREVPVRRSSPPTSMPTSPKHATPLERFGKQLPLGANEARHARTRSNPVVLRSALS